METERIASWHSPDYVAAVQVFYDRHLCRVPSPEPVEVMTV